MYAERISDFPDASQSLCLPRYELTGYVRDAGRIPRPGQHQAQMPEVQTRDKSHHKLQGCLQSISNSEAEFTFGRTLKLKHVMLIAGIADGKIRQPLGTGSS